MVYDDVSRRGVEGQALRASEVRSVVTSSGMSEVSPVVRTVGPTCATGVRH